MGELKCKFESMITFKEKPFEHGQPCSNCPQPSQCVMNQCKPIGKYFNFMKLFLIFSLGVYLFNA